MRAFLLLLLLVSLSSATATLNGTYCQSYASPGLVFPAPQTTQTLYAQRLCLTFIDSNTANVSVLPYVQASGADLVNQKDLPWAFGWPNSVPVSGLLPRYDLIFNAVVTGVGAPTQLMLTAVNDSSCYQSAPSFCCPLCDPPNGAFLLNLASGTWALEVVYNTDNTTRSIGLAPYDTSSRTFFGLPYAVTLTCTAAGSCNRISASSVVTGSINGLPGGDVWSFLSACAERVSDAYWTVLRSLRYGH